MNTGRYQPGLSYTEVLVAIALVALVALPTAQSIQSAVASARQGIDDTTHRFALQSLLETTLARSFDELEARAGDPASPVATEVLADGENADLYIVAWDIDNADLDDDTTTGVDDGVLWVSVTLRGTRLRFTTLIAR